MGTYLNPGNSGFTEIRSRLYVDKSGLIALINSSIGTKQKKHRKHIFLMKR